MGPADLIAAIGVSAAVAVAGQVLVKTFGLIGVLKQLVSRSEGLSVIYEDEDPEVDIVLVHGLGGDPIKTWEWRKDEKVVNWTTDFLPKALQNIRVLTYGYSPKLFTGIQGSSSSKRAADGRVLRYLPQALYLHSNRLIEELADLRSNDAQERPIIFVAHSLGGLIVKSSLVYASAAVAGDYDRLKSIELMTAGVLFFGTPQRELRWNRWSELLGKLFRISGLTALNTGIQPLKDQAEIFNLQIERYKSIEHNFINFSFHETSKKVTKLTKGGLVLKEEEAIPVVAKNRNWVNIALDQTHADLVKFKSPQDQNFLWVVSCMEQCIRKNAVHSLLYRYKKLVHWSSETIELEAESATTDKKDKDQWEKLKSRLSRVSPRDSDKTVESKQESNKRILHNCEVTNGLCSLPTLRIVDEIAFNAFEAGEYDYAEAWYKRLFVAIQEKKTLNSDETIDALKKVAQVAIRQGRLTEATDTLIYIREVQRKRGNVQNDVLQLSEHIARLQWSRGLVDEALGECTELIATLQNTDNTTIDGMHRLKILEADLWAQKGRHSRTASRLAQERYDEAKNLKIDTETGDGLEAYVVPQIIEMTPIERQTI